MVMLVEDMCRLLRIHENTLYKRIRNGYVPAFQRFGAGKGVRYEWRRQDVERWLLNTRSAQRPMRVSELVTGERRL